MVRNFCTTLFCYSIKHHYNGPDKTSISAITAWLTKSVIWLRYAQRCRFLYKQLRIQNSRSFRTHHTTREISLKVNVLRIRKMIALSRLIVSYIIHSENLWHKPYNVKYKSMIVCLYFPEVLSTAFYYFHHLLVCKMCYCQTNGRYFPTGALMICQGSHGD